MRPQTLSSAAQGHSAPVASPFLSREQILQATSRCLREHGYDNTTIRRIASILDCAVGSIYRYYTDKRDLLIAVTQDRLEPVAVLAGTPGSFSASVKLYHDLVKQTPEMYRLMFWLAYLSPTSQTEADRLPGVIRRILDGWAGQLGGYAVAQQKWAVLHGMILQSMPLETILPAVVELEALSTPVPRAELPRVVVTMQDPPPLRRAVTAQAVVVPPPVVQPESHEDVCLL